MKPSNFPGLDRISKKLTYFIHVTPLPTLTIIFIAGGFLPFMIWTWFVSKYYNGPLPTSPVAIQIMEVLVLTFSLFMFGCVGFIGVIRQEFPQGAILTGKTAIMLGAFVMVVFWGMAIYGLIYNLFRIFGQ